MTPPSFGTMMISTSLAPVLSMTSMRAPRGRPRVTLPGIPRILLLLAGGLGGRLGDGLLGGRPGGGLGRGHGGLAGVGGVGVVRLELLRVAAVLDDDEVDGLGQGAALGDDDLVAGLDVDVRRDVGGVAAGALLDALVLLDVALVLLLDDGGALHLGRHDGADDDGAAHGEGAVEGVHAVARRGLALGRLDVDPDITDGHGGCCLLLCGEGGYAWNAHSGSLAANPG